VAGMGEDWPRLHNPAFDFKTEALEGGITAIVAPLSDTT